MKRYRYLIVGGGMTGDAAVGGIREVDRDGEIGVIGLETDPPYNRPPLTKALWKGEPLESVWRKTESAGVERHLGRRVVALDPTAKTVQDDAGETYAFEKLLLATGGTPRKLPSNGSGVIYFRTLEDYRRLRAIAVNGASFAIIGGGFIGSEISAALAMNKKTVSLIFPEETIGARIFPRELGLFLNDYFREHGVNVRSRCTVSGVEPSGPRFILGVRDGITAVEGKMGAEGVVAGLGIVPEMALAAEAGLRVNDGIDVDDFLRTNNHDIYAAGDVAHFHNPALGSSLRVEHEDNANTMGAAAGRNMAGAEQRYDHLPFFYSDLFDLGYEAVGELDPRLEVVSDWKEKNREGVIYYTKGGRVRGVLLWNVFGQVDAARRLIAERGPFKPEDLAGRLRG